MSRHQFRGGISSTLAELDIDTSRLSGGGGADYPYLFWQIQLGIFPQKAPHTDYAFRTAEAQLYFLPGHKIADARPMILHRVLRGYHEHPGDEYLNFEFPLDP